MKIIEITAEKMTAQQLEEVKSSTMKEIHVLNVLKGHPSISEFLHVQLLLQPTLCYLKSYDKTISFLFLFSVTLIDSYESVTFIFLVFDL